MSRPFLFLLLFLLSASAFAQSINTSGVTAPFMHMYNQQKAMGLQQMEMMQRNQKAMARGQRNGAIINAIGMMCSSFFGGGQKPKKLKLLAGDIEEQAYNQLSERGPAFEESWDRGEASAAGAAANSTLAPGCSGFIGKDGRLGDWGTYAATLIRDRPDIYAKKEFSDTAKWCPSYSSLNATQREIVWVSVLSSIASPESSCDPSDVGKGTDGAALGLFQVWNNMIPDTCKFATDLHKPNQNIKCAVDRLSWELGNRNTLRTTTGNTYWGTLRSDPATIDAKGSQTFLALMGKIPLCNSSTLTAAISRPLPITE